MSLVAACAVAACGGTTRSSTATSRTVSRSSTATSRTASRSSTARSGTTRTAATTTASVPQRPGPEGIPLEAGPALASAATTTSGGAVDGIKCAPIEQLVYHIHAHLQVYVDGHPRALPAAIGLIGPVAEQTPYGPFYGAQRCYYWLHTHASDGVIHIESASVRVYTLGNFFDEWRQPLSRTQVAGAKGKVTAFVNGKAWTRDPRAIPLLPHASIQLDLGEPTVKAQVISWAGTRL